MDQFSFKPTVMFPICSSARW